ncbi:prepilin peptidase [Streptomyces sp. NPDC059454]|uniref:prepilin peptidase n=1 Tax=Streptomyces sp. NPDC059454 TaxID=3346836 RepID=UPI0036AA1EA7
MSDYLSDHLDVALIVAAALWGAAAGAVLPRAAYRFSVPPGEEWRTACPAGHPVGGWLGRARCGPCADPSYGPGADLSHGPGVDLSHGTGTGPSHGPGADPSYGPGVGPSYGPGAAPAAVTALVCAALAAATGTRPELGVWLLLAPVGVLLAVVDFRVQRLPDPLTLPFAGAALTLLGLAALTPEHAGEWTTALLGALALGAAYFVLFLVNPAGMGFGDVKLALGAGAVLGWYGWPTVMLGTLAGFVFGALYGGALVVARKAGRKTAIPFGPFLISGAFAGLLIGAYTA